MVGEQGFEPQFVESESTVLPARRPPKMALVLFLYHTISANKPRFFWLIVGFWEKVIVVETILNKLSTVMAFNGRGGSNRTAALMDVSHGFSH